MHIKELFKKLADGNQEGLTIDRYLEDFIPNVLLKSDTLQQAFGVSDLEMEEFYRQGYELYQKNDFKEAVTFFHWLVILNPFVAKYWMGFGACRQLLEEYEKALQAYATAILIDNVDPYPHFHAYECYEALGNREEAIKALLLANELAKAHPIYQSFRIEICKILNEVK